MFTGQSYGGHSSIRVSLPWHTNLTIETHYGTAFMILDSVMLTILATMSLSFVTRHANIITHKSQSSSLSLHRFLDLLALNTNHHTELGTQKDDTSVKERILNLSQIQLLRYNKSTTVENKYPRTLEDGVYVSAKEMIGQISK